MHNLKKMDLWQLFVVKSIVETFHAHKYFFKKKSICLHDHSKFVQIDIFHPSQKKKAVPC